ncbi:MAG: ABC transporter ATP-binding protein, partial [Eubacterium sp.]|nr:ABC transporter ATP-binding protein [Eubacterium sp.]
LDEPTNHLDAFSREELENTLMNYEGTMLIVSHDRYFINKLATRIVELTPNGCNNYLGNYDDYAEHRYVAKEEKAAKDKPKVNDYKLKKERQSNFRKLKTALSRCENDIEEIETAIAEIEEKLTNAPYDELMQLTEKLNELTQKRDSLYEQWEQTSAELEDYSDLDV